MSQVCATLPCTLCINPNTAETLAIATTIKLWIAILSLRFDKPPTSPENIHKLNDVVVRANCINADVELGLF